MLQHDVIGPGYGAWGFPVVLVKKKDGEVRFCIDYRSLNEVAVKDVYPIPPIDETLRVFGRSRLVHGTGSTCCPLASSYGRQGQRLVTRDGLYRFNRMSFGLCNAPATFQRMMDCILRGMLWICCLVYLDDIVIYSKGPLERHVVEVAAVLERLRNAGLSLKLNKCKFATPTIEYLDMN